LDDLWNIYDSNLRTQVQNDLDFARLHPNSLLALKLIRSRLTRQEGMKFYETYESVFQNFSDEVKASEEAKEMAGKLSYFKQSKIGSIAPEFTVKDSNGKQLSLGDFKGKKYILLDFWASWCGPCVEEFPYVKDLYKKYNADGFEIINISRDENLDNWKKSILKFKIESWSQVSTLENDDSVEKKYFVSGIPHKVLIDKNGVIIGKWKGGGEKNKNELQQILAEIFDKE
jgi:peroxiredoxin